MLEVGVWGGFPGQIGASRVLGVKAAERAGERKPRTPTGKGAKGVGRRVVSITWNNTPSVVPGTGRGTGSGYRALCETLILTGDVGWGGRWLGLGLGHRSG